MQPASLAWQGPATLTPDSTLTWAFAPGFADEPGVYLLTVEGPSCYLVNYVGISTRAIRARLLEHAQCYLSGRYWLNEPAQLFEAHTLVPVYRSNADQASFLTDLNRNLTAATAFVTRIRVFVAPLSWPRERLECIESAIIAALKADPEAAKVLENPRVSRIASSGIQIPVTCQGFRICGLPSELTL